jgi:hypothetical protein
MVDDSGVLDVRVNHNYVLADVALISPRAIALCVFLPWRQYHVYLWKMVHRDYLYNVLPPGEQLHQVIWYLLRMQNNTCYNPLRILICDKSVQLALHSVSVKCKHVSSQVVDQPVNSASTNSLSAGEEDGLHVSMV